MILIALDDDQHDVLIDTLHYLVRKMELQDNQGKEINVNRMKRLRSIQEQLLHPKPVVIFMNAGNTIATPELIYIDDDKIFINCDK